MFKVGDYVKIKNTSLEGIIASIHKDRCKIRINNKIMNTTINNIEFSNHTPSNIQSTKISIMKNSSEGFVPEIMLRHQHLDEAIENLDRFLYKAVLNKVTYVKIIHGKSGGTIRKGVIEYLKNSDIIDSFRLGYSHEGSYGVTIAKIK